MNEMTLELAPKVRAAGPPGGDRPRSPLNGKPRSGPQVPNKMDRRAYVGVMFRFFEFDMLRWTPTIRRLPLSMRKTNLARVLARRCCPELADRADATLANQQ